PGQFADQAVPLVGKGDHAGGQAVALLVGDDLDLAAFHDRDDGVRRAQVDADDFLLCHVHWLLSFGVGVSVPLRARAGGATVGSTASPGRAMPSSRDRTLMASRNVS